MSECSKTPYEKKIVTMKSDTTFQNDIYYTIEEQKRTEIKVKGSRFIASVYPTSSKENALHILDAIRKEFYDATHNCFAYRFGHLGLDFRASDDGEPNGTAGKPILFAMQKAGISDALVIVTRYYGGTKLGTGGLARAYSDSADAVLTQCTKKAIFKTTSVRIYCTYDDVKTILRLIEQFAVKHDGDYRDAIEFRTEIPTSSVAEFTSLVSSMTNARAGFVIDSD
jgi:uncharacterized YigZ family protein